MSRLLYRNTVFLPFASTESICDLNFLIHSSWKSKHSTWEWTWKHVHEHTRTHAHTELLSTSSTCLLLSVWVSVHKSANCPTFLGQHNRSCKAPAKRSWFLTFSAFRLNKDENLITVLVIIYQTFPLLKYNFVFRNTQYDETPCA